MQLLHQLWHNSIWNLEAYFEYNIWDGFIFNAYSIEQDKIWNKISRYEFKEILEQSFLDLQYYWWAISQWGKLNTYPFHPIHLSEDDTMTLSWIDLIFKWINFQIEKWFKKVVIPHTYYDLAETEKIITIIKSVNKKLKEKKVDWIEYYMTLPISNNILGNDDWIEKLLLAITDIDIVFDWYYITCESKPWTRKKVNDSYPYLKSVYTILSTLKAQDFSIIYGFANFDSIIFYSLIDIDYISFWSYENLRNFDIRKFTEEWSGWPSKGWYFSEKLLNMVKADYIELIRGNNWLDIVRNENNIFSEEILRKWYMWNTHKPQVHKNYLLSINKIFSDLSIYPMPARKKLMIEKIENARENYWLLENKHIYLLDESSDYHLSNWLSFLKAIQS